MAAEITSPRLNWVRLNGSSVGELSLFTPQRFSDLPDLNGALKSNIHSGSGNFIKEGWGGGGRGVGGEISWLLASAYPSSALLKFINKNVSNEQLLIRFEPSHTFE